MDLIYKLNLAHFLSTPGLTQQSILKKDKSRNKITD